MTLLHYLAEQLHNTAPELADFHKSMASVVKASDAEGDLYFLIYY